MLITSGGTTSGTQAGTRLLAPRFYAGGEIPLNGTDEARLLWIENMCETVLDCSSCPPTIQPAFNVSILDGALIIQWVRADVRLYMCGAERPARTLGRTGLVGMAFGHVENTHLSLPGPAPGLYRLGEYRHGLPRDGDTGIPFPLVDLNQRALNAVVDALRNGEELRAILTPGAPNPWESIICGYWKPLGTTLMLGHVWVAERAASCFIGHVQCAGLRFDLAQAASVTEFVAHLFTALNLHDWFLSFHWGLLPFGVGIALTVDSVILTCSSTLLLAGYWRQMILHDGLASVACESRSARTLARVAMCMNALASYFFFTEASACRFRRQSDQFASPNTAACRDV